MFESFSRYIVYDLLKLSQNTHFSGALEFFIYDIIKIFSLLSVIIFAISFIRSCFPPEKIRKILSHKKEFIGKMCSPFRGIISLVYITKTMCVKIIVLQLFRTGSDA
jgi:uncharacterized protein